MKSKQNYLDFIARSHQMQQIEKYLAKILAKRVLKSIDLQ